MKRISINLTVLFYAAVPGLGLDFLEGERRAKPNHLVPVFSAFPEYQKRIADHLLVTSSSHGLMISRPSFRGESAIAIYAKISEDVLAKHENSEVLVPDSEKSFFITYTQAKESLWYSMPKRNEEKRESKVEIQRHDLQISPSIALAIQRAWGRMLVQTRKPKRSYMGLDGATYEFGVFVRDRGFLRGQTWSPDSGLPAIMVELGEKLRQLAREGKSFTLEQEKGLLKELSEFESLTAKPKQVIEHQGAWRVIPLKR